MYFFNLGVKGFKSQLTDIKIACAASELLVDLFCVHELQSFSRNDWHSKRHVVLLQCPTVGPDKYAAGAAEHIR